MSFELDIAAIAAILLFLSILTGSAFLWISYKSTEFISTSDSVPTWSIGWVNFGLFICALIISVSYTQSLTAKLIEL